MTEIDFFERIKQNPRPVVVDFWAPWCVPCRMIEPVIKKLSADYADRVDVWKINADEQPDVLQKLHISGIPTLVAFKDGQEVARRTGAASPSVLSNLFEASLSGEKPVKASPGLLDRILRLFIGTAMFFLAFQRGFSGFFLLLAGLGALIAFTAVYDHCPIYLAVSSRLKTLLRKDRPDQPRTS
jgi:thioredoxin